ncbi:MAG: glycosyl hydrolase family 28-related protein [Cyanobacteria bacterium J06554_1]
MAESIHVSDFGAVGDGVTPDDIAIQLAINKSIEANKPVQFSAKTYLIQNELLVPNFIALQGVPRCGSQGPDNSSQGRTILRAGTKGMRSIMAITSNRSVRIQDIIFDANMKAMHGLYLMGVSLSSFERIGVGGACSDDIHQPKKDDAGNDTINDTNVWRELSCSRNGTLYVTPDLKDVDQVVSPAQLKVLDDAEISIDPSSRLVTCSGTDFDLTELGLRTGDPMRIIGDSYDQYCFKAEIDGLVFLSNV